MKKRESNQGAVGSAEEPIQLPGPVTVGEGRTAVHLQLLAQGRDFLVLITGGTAHIGAVGVCDGRTSHDHVRASEGLVQVPGHREGPLAAEAAETLATAAGRTCTAVVGIHQDNATPEEIHEIVAHAREGLGRIATVLAEGEKT